MIVWILTNEVNEYDQCGEYFLGVFGKQPTRDQLRAMGVAESEVEHVLAGGGRRGDEYCWFHLTAHTIEGEME